MKNPYLLLPVIIILLVTFAVAYYFYSNHNTQVENQLVLPVPNTEKFIEKSNQHRDKLKKSREHHREQAKKPSTKEKLMKYWNKMTSLQSSQVAPIEFYGKVVDQYNQPAAGATVVYSAGGVYLASGTGVGKTQTNAQGVFALEDAKGVSFSVDNIIHPAYQYQNHFHGVAPVNFNSHQRFPDSRLWQDYNQDNPYVFTVWKIDSYPKTKVSKEKGYSLTPDGRTSTFDLLTKGKPFKKGLQEGDFTISFDEVGENWVARIESLAGGLIETDDLYMNLAPETGYQTAVTYNFAIGRRNIEIKNYYLKMRDEYYGRVKVEYRAYPNRKGKATVYVSSVVNLEKGRNLTIKKQ